MASQLAQVIKQYGQTMPGGGLERGVQGFYEMREMGERKKAREKTAELTDIKIGEAKLEQFKNKYSGQIAAANTPEKWMSAQGSGFLPKDMPYEQREPFLMGLMQEKALRTTATSKAFQPVMMTDPATGKKTQMMPTYDPATGEATYAPLKAPEGMEIAKETAAEKREKDVAAKGKEVIVKGSANVGMDAYKQAGAIKSNIANLQSVISAVGEGAETGPLAKKLPSFRAASIKLDNIRNRLGLDVIGSVTFGALSEGELNLALDTALPTGLEGPELVKWANDKITAQRKLARYYEDQAEFLLEGNSVLDWMRTQKERGASPTPTIEQPTGQPAAAQALPPTNEQGWKLMKDAAGNQAYVGPNGEVQEVR